MKKNLLFCTKIFAPYFQIRYKTSPQKIHVLKIFIQDNPKCFKIFVIGQKFHPLLQYSTKYFTSFDLILSNLFFFAIKDWIQFTRHNIHRIKLNDASETRRLFLEELTIFFSSQDSLNLSYLPIFLYLSIPLKNRRKMLV